MKAYAATGTVEPVLAHTGRYDHWAEGSVLERLGLDAGNYGVQAMAGVTSTSLLGHLDFLTIGVISADIGADPNDARRPVGSAGSDRRRDVNPSNLNVPRPPVASQKFTVSPSSPGRLNQVANALTRSSWS